MKRTSDNESSALTPLMRQFYAVKDKHPDKILFFRMGDFYEMFGDDAVRAAPILGIALTSRSHGGADSVPLAGVPHHSADKYLAKLLASGEKVVVVEQVEDPRTARGIVKREIVEILTPGTATVEASLSDCHPLRLVAVHENDKRRMGLASLDMSTGVFVVYEAAVDETLERLRVLEPSEVLYSSGREEEEFIQSIRIGGGTTQTTAFGEWNFDYKTAERELNQHFGTTTLEGFGISNQRLAVAAAGAILRYLKENHRHHLSHIDKLSIFDSNEYMPLDFSTVRNLELVKNLATSGEDNSLFSIANFCQTAAGARRLRDALVRPFRTKAKIDLRLSAVSELVKDRDTAYQLRQHTRLLSDLEKLAGRLGIGKINPRQMRSVRDSLVTAVSIKSLLKKTSCPHLNALAESMPNCDDVITTLDSAVADDPPVVTNKGDIFKKGYSAKLDELNDSIRDARLYIGSLQAKERERTGISNLKVGFNKVFGYYIEVTRANVAAIPENYMRKQTLVNAERYITPELKEKEELILNAEEKIFKLEQDLYLELMDYIKKYIGDLKLCASLLAETDLVSGLTELAVQNSYCRPDIYEDTRLKIINGRHPVIESVSRQAPLSRTIPICLEKMI